VKIRSQRLKNSSSSFDQCDPQASVSDMGNNCASFTNETLAKFILNDHTYSQQEDLEQFRKSKKLNTCSRIISNQRRRLKVLRERNRRLPRHNNKLQTCLSELRKKQLVGDDSFDVVMKTLPPNAAAIMERCQKGKNSHAKFNAQLRTFALTLNFYSPKAYEYVRSCFANALPSSSTLKRWYKCIGGNPGITEESLSTLKIKVAEQKALQKTVSALVMDEMAMRKKVEWNGERYHGFVDMGTSIDDDSLPEAKEALVFLLVAINGRWKIPFAYYLIARLSGTEKAAIVVGILEAVHETGVRVVSLTFDGAHSNIANSPWQTSWVPIFSRLL
jgi:Transposase protein